jgi:hypothetical protein
MRLEKDIVDELGRIVLFERNERNWSEEWALEKWKRVECGRCLPHCSLPGVIVCLNECL